ncbi:hypothetical protein ACC785_37605, partial [Rhizobium ruizarguesonis]
VTNYTAELSSPGPNVTIADDLQSITAAVQDLKGQGVNKIIALTHFGYPRDLALGIFDDSAIVEIDDEIAEILAVGGSLDDRHFIA